MSATETTAKPHYQFDAFRAQRELRERMADYLLDVFNVRHPELATRLRRNWTESGAQTERLFAPMLIQGAFPFRPDKTVAELQSSSLTEHDPERPLHPRTVAILRDAGIRYPLYEHQVSTLRAAAQGKTVVLSAGTGSGKTEAFLIPLLDRLFWDRERGLDDLSRPGVRALIIYPLNALVNNQIERIRELLCRQQDISFAYYTGRLKDRRTEAENAYRYAGRELPPECQIIDRQSLRGLGDARKRRQGPPHILVTNFAMLEYMLIRPQDHSIFAHTHENGRPRLRAIVLDEAHVYGGAQAAEIHMLLRRAALRFGTRLEHIQGYATSATLGSDDDEGELRRFAAKMFSASERDVAAVTGRRYLPAEGSRVREDLGALRAPSEPPAAGALIPEDLQTLHFDDDSRPMALVHDEALARKAAEACVALGLAESAEVAALVAAAEGQPARLLHHVISRHPRLVALRQWLFEGRDGSDETRHEARYLDEVVRRLFPDRGENPDDAAQRATYALLQLGSLARLAPERHPYIPTRMHLFVRTPAGVWVDPRPGPDSSAAWPWGAVTSQPRAGFDEDQPWLRLYLCRSCGEPLLRAWEKPDGWGDTSFAAAASPGAAMVLVSPDTASERRLPDAWGGHPVRIMQIGASSPATGEPQAQQPCRCPRCDSPVAELDQLEDLQLAAQSALPALVDAIYPSLGEVAQGRGGAPLPGGGRRLLTFSDSRQGAARVAAEVERTHDIGVNRQLLWRLLEDADQPVSFEELREELARHPLLAQRAEASALEAEADEDERETFLDNLAQVSIYEALSMPPVRVNTLESLGLVEVRYPGLERVEVPAELRDMLSQEEWIGLLATVLDDARRRGAIAKPAGLDDAYKPLRELLPYSRMGKVLTFAGGLAEIERGEVRESSVSSDSNDASGGARSDRRIALCPLTRPEQSRMRDFVTRLCRRHGLGVDPVSVLRAVWDALEKLVDKKCRWLKRDPAGAESGLQPGIQIDLRKLAFLPHAGGPPFFDPITGRVYFRSVMDVSSELGSDRSLRPMSPEDRAQWAQRHAVRRVREHALLGLWSVEHTAQLDVDELERQERQFKRGERNLMASSTTMEMGVDLGGLTLVMLTNVPPGPANYWQRAGRAGRRTDGSSMVLTLAQPRPHDQRVFSAPRAFLERSIVPPQVRLDTRALLLRHVNAYLLAEFYRAVVKPGKDGNPMRAFGSVGEFLLHDVGERLAQEVSDELVTLLAIDARENLADVFLRWLDIVTLDERREATVRERLLAGTCLATEPLDALARACKRAFEPASLRARRERDVLKQRAHDEMERGEGKRDESYLRLLARQQRVLEREALLSYLVRNDFLPRFGFPVDVVKLDTTWKRSERDEQKPHPDEDGQALRMERGLDLALAEYVPGGDVIAKKRVHRVAGLDRSWLNEEAGMAMNRYYSECNVCHYVTFGDVVEPRECEACKHPTESERSFVERSKRDTHRSQEATEDASLLFADGRPPSPVRRYLEPVGFAVKFGRSPRRVMGRIHRMPAPRVTIGPGSATLSELMTGALSMGFTPGSPLFIRSEGNYPRFVQPADSAMRMAGYGYRICKWCGLAEPESAWNEKQPPRGYDAHALLRGRESCPHGRQWWDHAVLGVRQGVDAYRVRLGGDLAPATNSHAEAERFHLSLAVCLRQVAADMLAIDPRTLQPAVAAYWDDEDVTGLESVIYDASGSGLLAHLDESPLELMRRTCALLETRELAEFVQFDTQFLIEQGVLDIPWLRRHFVEDSARHARLMRDSALFEQEEASPMRGQTLRMAAQSLIEDGMQEIALQAVSIDDTAFEPGQVLRAVWARAIRGDRDTGPVRLLIGELPGTHSDPAHVLLASRLAQLIEHGVEVRRSVPAAVATPLDEECWSVLARASRGLRALGGMRSEGESLRAWTGPTFGRAWLEGGIAVENRSSAAAELAWEQFEERWRDAAPVTAEMLRPRTENRQWVLVIHAGDGSPQATDLAVILQERTGLGSLRELGAVTALSYSDRYVGRSAVAMWMLARLLALFAYADGARGKIRCVEPRSDALRVDGSVENVFGRRMPPDNLDRETASHFRKWCEQEGKKRGLELRFRHGKEKDIGHQRRLQVAFAPGGRVSSMVVLFDHGLDWVRPISGSDTRPWTEQKLTAEASHIVVLLDPDRR